jgi:hypothetical protein
MPSPLQNTLIAKLSEEQRASVLRFLNSGYPVDISVGSSPKSFIAKFTNGDAIEIKGSKGLSATLEKLGVEWRSLLESKANQLGAVSAVVGREESVRVISDALKDIVNNSDRNMSLVSSLAEATYNAQIQSDVFGSDYGAFEDALSIILDSPSIREKLAEVNKYPFDEAKRNEFVIEFFGISDSLGIDWYHEPSMPTIEGIEKDANVISVEAMDNDKIREGLVSYFLSASRNQVKPTQVLSNLHSKMYKSEISLDVQRAIYSPDLEPVGYPPYMFSSPLKTILSEAYKKALGGESAESIRESLETIVAYNRPIVSRGKVPDYRTALTQKAKHRAAVGFSLMEDRLDLSGASQEAVQKHKQGFINALSLNGLVTSDSPIQGWVMGLRASEAVILGVSASRLGEDDGVNPKSIEVSNKLGEKWAELKQSDQKMSDVALKVMAMQPVVDSAWEALNEIGDESSLGALASWARHFNGNDDNSVVSPWLTESLAEDRLDELSKTIPNEIFEINLPRVKESYKEFGSELEEHAKANKDWEKIPDFVRQVVPLDPEADFKTRLNGALNVSILSSILKEFRSEILPGIRENKKNAPAAESKNDNTLAQTKKTQEPDALEKAPVAPPEPEPEPEIEVPTPEPAKEEPVSVPNPEPKVTEKQEEQPPIESPEKEVERTVEPVAKNPATETDKKPVEKSTSEAPQPASSVVEEMLKGKNVKPAVVEVVNTLYGPPPEDIRQGLDDLYERITESAFKNGEPHLTDEFQWIHERWMDVTQVDLKDIDESSLPAVWEDVIKTFGPLVATRSDKKVTEWYQNDAYIQGKGDVIRDLTVQLAKTFSEGDFPDEHVNIYMNAIECLKAPIYNPDGTIAANVSESALVGHSSAIEDSIRDFIFTAPEDQKEHLSAVIDELKKRDRMYQVFSDAAQESPAVGNALAEHFEAMYKDPTEGLVLKTLRSQNEKVEYLVSDPAIFERLKNSKDRKPNSDFFADYRRIGEDFSDLYAKDVMDVTIPGITTPKKDVPKARTPEPTEESERPRMRA